MTKLTDAEVAQELGRDALEEAFCYLDELRASGRTNMWAAHAFLARDLLWPEKEASAATGLWMHTFDKERSPEQRIAELLAA